MRLPSDCPKRHTSRSHWFVETLVAGTTWKMVITNRLEARAGDSTAGIAKGVVNECDMARPSLFHSMRVFSSSLSSLNCHLSHSRALCIRFSKQENLAHVVRSIDTPSCPLRNLVSPSRSQPTQQPTQAARRHKISPFGMAINLPSCVAHSLHAREISRNSSSVARPCAPAVSVNPLASVRPAHDSANCPARSPW